MKRRKPLKRRTGLTSRKQLNRSKRMKRKNARRSAKEFRRAYGSQERVQAVQAMSCVVCKRLPSENAHLENGGMGRKADKELVVNLCSGCHTDDDLSLHRLGSVALFDRTHGTDLYAAAARVASELEGI